MNTKLELTYKDASNNGYSTSFVVAGPITGEGIALMRDVMVLTDADGCFIIAHELGLPTPSELMAEREDCDFPTDDDHVYTIIDQFNDEDPSPKDFLTDEPPTDPDFTIAVLMSRLLNAPWDVAAEMKRLNMEF